uniref:Uncharacterized protein n=1 Tax=Molossus molossus TaxID=27622 RepID=A0A7J8F987_MOLMO|nr:hypothetical protein HJG59_008605 [Molossus molossus]
MGRPRVGWSLRQVWIALTVNKAPEARWGGTLQKTSRILCMGLGEEEPRAPGDRKKPSKRWVPAAEPHPPAGEDCSREPGPGSRCRHHPEAEVTARRSRGGGPSAARDVAAGRGERTASGRPRAAGGRRSGSAPASPRPSERTGGGDRPGRGKGA